MHSIFPAMALLAASAITAAGQASGDFQKTFSVEKKNLGIKGDNPYFPLKAGYRLIYKHGAESDTLTVLSETKIIDGVEVRIVEDREESHGRLKELTNDYYAIDAITNDVYYFGEDVDVYKNGKLAGHEGAWRSGVNGAHFGLMMPGRPQPGMRFYQELAPGVGMDRAEIVSQDEKITTPAGTFDHCLHVVETTPLEKGAKDHKLYAPGIGPVKDGEFVLVRYENR